MDQREDNKIATNRTSNGGQNPPRPRPNRLKLPFDNRSQDIGTWAYDHRIGLCVTIIIYLLLGIGFFAFTAVFQFVTLPVEFNASNRAINVIESNGLLSFEEKMGAEKVLKAAAMTYVAALAVSLAQLLRLIFRFTGRRR